MKTLIKTLLLLSAISFQPSVMRAQLNPFGAMYFQNPYINNPAMAGRNKGLFVNMSARTQWAGVPGSPTTQVLTGEYNKGKVGLGVNLNNDAAGLIKRTRAMASYAYHLPLDDNGHTLSFGLSLGFMNERVENSELNGDPGDVSVGRYNSRDTYLDGDFGIAYLGDRLNLQFALPNAKNFLKRDVRSLGSDRPTFMASASYRVGLRDELAGVELEPLICFRGVHGYDNIVDAGTGIWMNEKKMLVQAVYHSSKSTTFGLQLNYWQRFSILGVYTTETAALHTYTSGTFEIGLKMKAF